MKLLERTNANKNTEILKTMMGSIDKLFLKLYLTVVFENEIRWYECNFIDGVKLK